jgi:hypothetical protein
MSFLYLRSPNEQRVFRLPIDPSVSGNQRTGFTVSVAYDDIRADNRVIVETGQWLHAVRPFFSQPFGPRYTRELAVSAFKQRHYPEGLPITADEYEQLYSEYEKIALGR